MNIFKTGVVKKRLSIIFIALALLACIAESFAADPGHSAPAIGTGMFESGNYTFPDTLHVQNYLNVSGLLWVDPVTSMVGIGTTSNLNLPLNINGTYGLPASGVGMLRLQESAYTSTLNFGLMGPGYYGGWIQAGDSNNAYGYPISLNPSGGNVGIGTTIPAFKLQVEGDINASSGGLLQNATSCDSLDTDANGLIICGTDTGGVADLTNVAFLNDTQTFTGLNEFTGNVTMTDNLTVGGNALYVDSSSGSVGIGTTTPTHTFSAQGTMNITRAAGAAGGIEVTSTGDVIIRLG